MENYHKAVLVRCMDARHDGKLTESIRAENTIDTRFYELTPPGGAGVLAGEIFNDRLESLIFDIKLTMELGAEAVFLVVHGSNEADTKGCGGYIYSGKADAYETPQTSRAFSRAQLEAAVEKLHQQGITMPVHAYYVTFSKDGNNLLEVVRN